MQRFTIRQPGPEVIKKFHPQISKFFVLIIVKMPTIVGSLIFVSRENSILNVSEPEKAEFVDIFIHMSIQNFMLSSDEHEIFFYNLGARLWLYEIIRPLEEMYIRLN